MATLQTVSQSVASGLSRANGAQANVPSGTFGEVFMSELNPIYYSLIKQGRVYSLSGTGLNPSAFGGVAAGTPLLGVWNPAGSGVDLVPIMLNVAIRTTGTAVVATDFNFWTANQGTTAITGTQTAAKNMYTQATTGSAMYGMVNVANTAAVASTLSKASFSIGLTAGTAVTNVQLLQDELKGLLLTSPGSYLAWGSAASLTAASIDFSFIWAEIPV